MLFNSLQFAVFFTITYSLYIILNHRRQNTLLLIASYVFYAYWDYRFLSVILVLTVFNYIFGIRIHQSSQVKERKIWLTLSICLNLGILAFFKYFNFFTGSLQSLFSFFGCSLGIGLLHIILPLGISFYIFRILTYSIDIYRKELTPARNIFDLAVYVAFFPLVLAGPIERAKSLLPQIANKREVGPVNFCEGGWLIFYGLFKKIFIADNMAKIVSQIFVSNAMGNGVLVLLGSYAFAFQIYADFSGYSDIARGVCRLMGFDIMENFKFPYFAVNPSDFWRRWHISLSTWFRDYVYIPMGGSRVPPLFLYRNLMITMVLAGLWHGASWVFVIWGFYLGVLLVIYHANKLIFSSLPLPKISISPRISFCVKALVTFNLVSLGWLIFRAESFGQLWSMLHSLIFKFELVNGIGVRVILLRMFALVWLMFLIDALQFRKNDLFIILKRPVFIRFALYLLMLSLMYIYGDFGEKEFIYLQF